MKSFSRNFLWTSASIIGLLIAIPAIGQTITPTTPIDRGLSQDHRPSGFRLIDVRTESVSFAAGGSVYLDLSAEVSNRGDANGEYLIAVDVTGSERLFVTKRQQLGSGMTQEIPIRLARKFSCQGATKFSIVVSIVDRWSGFDRRGEPLNPRKIDPTLRWIDAPLSKLGKGAKAVDCEGEDPFAGGFRLEDADLSAPIMTPLDSDQHGFNFANSFRNNWLPAIDKTTGGLCGGMMYTVLDYYYAGREIPQQDYRPADHTTLYRYLWDRQQSSIESNLDHWFELRQNPGGIRNTTIFNWGLKERLADIREHIDRGEPALLGLKGANGSGDHQVLAIGYFLGRYLGDLGEHKEDLKIFTHDPNFPNRIMTLVPHLEREFYYYKELEDRIVEDDTKSDDEKTGMYYQAYFVDENYHRQSPPPIPNPVYPDDGMVYELVVGIETSSDDLRGGSEVDATIVRRDGSAQLARDINGGRRWIEDYMQHAQLILDEPLRYQDLKEVRFAFRSGGPGTHDNWDIRRIWISARGFDRHLVYDLKAAPLVRFTGARNGFIAYLNTVSAPDSHVRQVDLTLRTGGDDLRGGNDNVDAYILFTDGSYHRASVINNFLPLRNNTTLTYPVALEFPRPASDIQGIRLMKSEGNDNWNLDSIQVDFKPVRGETYTRHIDWDAPLDRFTGSEPIREYTFE